LSGVDAALDAALARELPPLPHASHRAARGPPATRAGDRTAAFRDQDEGGRREQRFSTTPGLL
jgi:hypothetical protein